MTSMQNVNGQVTLYDDQGAPSGEFRVPRGMSFMSAMGSPDLRNGDEFRDDWWRYRDGVRFRKWFLPAAGFKRIWPPDLDNPARIFRLMLRLRQRLDRAWTTIMAECAALLPDGAAMVAVVVPRRTDGGPLRVEIEREMFSTKKIGYCIGPPEDGTETPAPASFTRAFWYQHSAATRWGGIRELLRHALERRVMREVLADEKKARVPILIRLCGLDFWFTTRFGRYGQLEVETIAWPETQTLAIDLDAEARAR